MGVPATGSSALGMRSPAITWAHEPSPPAMIVAWVSVLSKAIGLDALNCKADGGAGFMSGCPAQAAQLRRVVAKAWHIARPAARATRIDDLSVGRAEMGNHHLRDILDRGRALARRVVDRYSTLRLRPGCFDRVDQIRNIEIRFGLPPITQHDEDVVVLLQFLNEIIDRAMGGSFSHHIGKAEHDAAKA